MSRPAGVHTQPLRCLRMLRYLAARAGRFQRLGSLAETFGVTDRTIRRDVLALQEAGEPVDFHGGAVRYDSRPGRAPRSAGRHYPTVARVVRLLRAIESAAGGQVFFAWLADALGVSARTIRRDVRALISAGEPVRVLPQRAALEATKGRAA